MILGTLKRRIDFVSVRDFGVFVRSKNISIQVCRVVLPEVDGGTQCFFLSQSDVGKDSPQECPQLEDQERCQPEEGVVFFGVTASRKVGNAVVRNRAKRRVRAWCRLNLVESIQRSVHDEEAFPSTSLEKRVTVSKRTALSLKKRPTDPQKTSAWAGVFIANAHTPEVPFQQLSQEIDRTLQLALKIWYERHHINH